MEVIEKKSSVGHYPDADKWVFDESVTDVFEDMLERSVPQLDVMRKACLDVGSRHVQDGRTVLDIGCSRGHALEAFVDRFGARCLYLGLEVSEPMLGAAREKFGGMIDAKIVRIERSDLREEFQLPPVCVALSVLTLMFVPVNYRQRLLRRVYDSLVDGGCLILVEKVLGGGALIDARMDEIYHTFKRVGGYSDEEIRRKALSLEGVLVPMTARMNEDLLYGAGFREIDCFWRWMNFAGWVVVK